MFSNVIFLFRCFSGGTKRRNGRKSDEIDGKEQKTFDFFQCRIYIILLAPQVRASADTKNAT